MAYKLSKLQSIPMKSIRQIGRNNGIFRQHHVAQFSRKLEFTTDASNQTRFPKETEKLGQFLSQFQSFKPLMERSNSGILVNLEDYKERKKLLKESLKKLEDELESLDDRSLFGILLYCLEMSDKCLNYNFNLKLVELLISRFQSYQSVNRSVVDKHTTTTIASSTSDDTSSTSGDFINALDSNSSELGNVLGLDYSSITKILDEEVHLVYLLSTFLKLKLYSNLEKHFEFFYLSLNRNVGNYSSENLVELCKTLGDLYLLTDMGGLKILVQKCVYSLLEQIDRYNVNVPVYSWIQVIKSVNKSNENHLFKKLVPYLTSTIQSSPYTAIVSNYYHFDPKVDVDQLSEEESRKCYKFVKLNVHLLNTLLMTGIIDNLNLYENLLELISKFLVFYTKQTSKSKTLGNSLGYFTNTRSVNEYNKPNELVNELLYKRYSNKLFKSPPTILDSNISADTTISTGTTSDDTSSTSGDYVNAFDSNSSDLPSYEKTEQNIIQCGLLNLLHNGKVSFVRGLKLSEMHMRTLYPSLYSKLSRNNLLQVARQFPFENEKEYVVVSNTLNENRELILKLVSEQESPLIVLVDIYYLICTNYNKKIYVEVLDVNSSKIDNKHSNTTSKGDNNYNDMNNNDNNTHSSTSNKPIKLSKQMEFKQLYLKSLGWTCVQIYKS